MNYVVVPDEEITELIHLQTGPRDMLCGERAGLGVMEMERVTCPHCFALLVGAATGTTEAAMVEIEEMMPTAIIKFPPSQFSEEEMRKVYDSIRGYDLPGTDLVGPIRRIHYGGQWTPRRMGGRTLWYEETGRGEALGYAVGAEPSPLGTGFTAVFVLTTAGRNALA
jgi:hypothetical protein